MDKIVAVEIDEETSQARVWQRVDGTVVAHDVEFRPWLVSSFKNRQHGAKVRPLEGDNAIRWFHSYPDTQSYERARHQHPYGKALIYQDFRHQFLALNPEYRLFQGMKFEELSRFSFDIEATGLDPAKDEMLLVTVHCDYGTIAITGTEQEMFDQVETLIHAVDPDTIEGYNIFGYDIPFMMSRAANLGMELNWGRDRSPVEIGRQVNFRVGSYERSVQTYACYGRHMVDGLLVAQRYDANTQGQFENFGLKYLTKAMGISGEDRVYIDTSRMAELWYNSEADRNLIITYGLQDAEETYRLIAMMVQPEFYLATIIPDTYQNILIDGNAKKINTLLIGEYLNANYSIPTPPGNRGEYEGGAVECRLVGVFRDVAKADVASLYPSIMLNDPGAIPRNDTLGAFKSMLQDLTAKRLDLKHREQAATDAADRKYLHGLNWAYKILINSFYGYLAVGLHFSDYDAAAQVTRVGRGIVNDMADQLEAMGMGIIEIDTDGVYFTYPNNGRFPVEAIPEFLDLLPWIKVEVEDLFDVMISVKAKNYVLKKKGKDGLVYHGNSLRSRRDEKFGKQFIEAVVGRLISGDVKGVDKLYRTVQKQILAHEIAKDDISKRERISQKTFDSPAKARLRAAVDDTELGEGDYIYVYTAEDGTLKTTERYRKGDADRFHYLERLHKFAQRIQPVLDGYGITLERMTKKVYNEILGIVPVRKTRAKKEATT